MSAQTLCNPSASGLDGHLSQGQPLLPGTHSASNSAEGIRPLPAKQITPASPREQHQPNPGTAHGLQPILFKSKRDPKQRPAGE